MSAEVIQKIYILEISAPSISTRGVVIVILLILKSPLLNKVFPTKVFHIFL